MKILKKVLGNFLDLIFPRHCVGCGKCNPDGEFSHLCAECKNVLFAKKLNRCKRCAEVVIAGVPYKRCSSCDDLDLFFDEANACSEYDGAARELVVGLKYENQPYLAKDIAKLIAQTDEFCEYFKDSILVPVPLYPSRKRKRGYNQSEEICKAIIAQNPNLNISLSNILLRNRPTPTQTALTRKEREENVKGAFALAKNSIPRNAKIIILDDVMTSGATLNECARVLKKSKFESVKVFAFCRRSKVFI